MATFCNSCYKSNRGDGSAQGAKHTTASDLVQITMCGMDLMWAVTQNIAMWVFFLLLFPPGLWLMRYSVDLELYSSSDWHQPPYGFADERANSILIGSCASFSVKMLVGLKTEHTKRQRSRTAHSSHHRPSRHCMEVLRKDLCQKLEFSSQQSVCQYSRDYLTGIGSLFLCNLERSRSVPQTVSDSLQYEIWNNQSRKTLKPSSDRSPDEILSQQESTLLAGFNYWQCWHHKHTLTTTTTPPETMLFIIPFSQTMVMVIVLAIVTLCLATFKLWWGRHALRLLFPPGPPGHWFWEIQCCLHSKYISVADPLGG
jgi:hypothetical protein